MPRVPQLPLSSLSPAARALAEQLDKNQLIAREAGARADGNISADELKAALVARDNFTPGEQVALDEIVTALGLERPAAPQPGDGTSRPDGTYSPALARHAPVQGTGDVDQGGDDSRLTSKAPPKALASVYDYIDTTGPTARVLGRRKGGRVKVFATPGAELNLYNADLLDGTGKPKLVHTITVPHDTMNPLERARNMMAYDRREFERDLTAEDRAHFERGFVPVDVALPNGDDWEVGDTLWITQKLGTRDESDPVSVLLPGGNHKREAYVELDRVSVGKDAVEATEDLAVPPNTFVQLSRNGVLVGEPVISDEKGRFRLTVPGRDKSGSWGLATRSHQSIEDARRSLDPATTYRPAKSISSGSGPLEVTPLSGIAEDGQAQAASWESVIMDALFAPPDRQHVTRFKLEGLPPGMTITARNLANDPIEKTFKADDDGRVAVLLDEVAVGDFVTIRSEGMMLATGREKKLDVTIQTPTAEQAARIDFVRNTLELPDEDHHGEAVFGLALFGPGSASDELRCMTDEKLMRTIHEGARIGYRFRKGWGDEVRAHLAANGASPELLRGFDVGVKMGGHRPIGAEGQVVWKTLKQPETNMVITGGYSPISGSHGPLRPEYVRGPGEYEVTVEGFPPLRVRTAGGRPQGWVNPNAYGLVYGMSVGTGEHNPSFHVVPPGGGPL